MAGTQAYTWPVPTPRLYRRIAADALSAALVDTPVVLIQGPRQCGKTTLAQQVGRKRRYGYYTFDDAATLSAARTDITGFVARLETRSILDEVQLVPELFAALKPRIDSNRNALRLILTGSSNVLLIPRLSDSLAGRMEIIRLHPLSQAEIERISPGFLDALFAPEGAFAHAGRLGRELAERIVRGGYPVPLARAPRRRQDWYVNYVDALVQRDVREMAHIGSLSAIPKLLALAATQTGRLVNLSEMASAFELSRPTIVSYLTLIERLFLIEYLPPWFSNRAKRLVKTSKLHFSDTGLACSLLRCGAAELDEQRDLLGQLLKSFVFGELSRQSAAHPAQIDLYHLRDKDGYEVDLVLQLNNSFAGIEVKAASTVTSADFRGLRRMREIVGARFCRGVVLYDGDHVLPFGEGMLAVPLSALWCTRSK